MTSPLQMPAPTGRFGIYVHAPFCARHCPYCDFAVVVRSSPPFDAWVAGVTAELDAEAPRWQDRVLRTVYLGGGTPSLLRPADVQAVLDAIRARYNHTTVVEVTIEANPEHATPDLVAHWRDAGVTRVSWGVQSTNPASLALLGRNHSPEQAAAAIGMSRDAGIGHISADLIFALPGQDVDAARADARALARLAGLDHVSAYELTYEPRTSLTRRRDRGELLSVDEDGRAAILEGVAEELGQAGFERYEVSNYARPGGRSEHNSAYWAGHEYLGVGPGAHGLRLSKETGCAERGARHRAFRAWLQSAGAGYGEIEQLDAATHLAECAMLALRTREGLAPGALGLRFGPAATTLLEPLLLRWSREGLGAWDGERFVPGGRAFDLADELAVQILTAVDPYRNDADSVGSAFRPQNRLEHT